MAGLSPKAPVPPRRTADIVWPNMEQVYNGQLFENGIEVEQMSRKHRAA